MQLLVAAACLALFARHASSSPAPAPLAAEEKRAACIQDNLLRALQSPSRLADSYSFCSRYISVPSTATVTSYTATCVLSSFSAVKSIYHPLYLFNIQPVFSSPSPLSYNSASPTPIKVPGDPQSYRGPGAKLREKRDEPAVEPVSAPRPTSPPALPQELLRRSNPSLPSYIATTYPPSRLSSACSCLSVPAAHTTVVPKVYNSVSITTTCTSFVGTTLASYAAFCAPSLQANVPVPLSHANYRVVPNFQVASKLDCCAACTSVFNCVWWKFDFGTKGDGWKPGMCHYAYFTGTTLFVDGEQPAICPNGLTKALDIVKYPMNKIGLEANNNDPGYNFGACGGGFNVYESSGDEGLPDDYDQRVCGGGQGPVYSGSGC